MVLDENEENEKEHAHFIDGYKSNRKMSFRVIKEFSHTNNITEWSIWLLIFSTAMLHNLFLFFIKKISRVFVGKLQPPVIPFMPLLLKDMTFAHEGNKTSLDGLVNFEKMHMMAQTMRTIRFCRSRHLGK